MAYIPTEWATGDVITAALLNKAENGIAAASALICLIEFSADGNSATIDQTYDDIVAAITAGRPVIFINVDSEYGIICHYLLIGTYDAADSSSNQVLLYGQSVDTGSLVQLMFNEVDDVLTWEKTQQ